MHKLQAPIHEIVSKKKYVEVCLQDTCSELRPLYDIVRIFLIFQFTKHRQILKVLLM